MDLLFLVYIISIGISGFFKGIRNWETEKNAIEPIAVGTNKYATNSLAYWFELMIYMLLAEIL